MITREQIEEALHTLGVIYAAAPGHPTRWSASDLATDLAPLLAECDNKNTPKRSAKSAKFKKKK